MVVTEVLQQLAHSLQEVCTALVLVAAVTDLNMLTAENCVTVA
jgi:hypothetical protein